MKKMKKLIGLLLVVALVGAAIGGTLAYLQDTDSDVNVMTLGNVYIEQHEYQRADDVEHNAGEAGAGNGVKEGALVPFVQGQALYPAVPANNVSTDYSAEASDLFFWGDYVYSGTAGNGLWNDSKLSNVMDKMVFVENTGKSDAYFRTIIAFECPEGMEYSQGPDKEFMMNINGSDLYSWENVGYITVDGVRYLVEVATYQKALEPTQQAHPSLLQVVMTHNATNEDMELLGDTYEILVLSQAVQTEGFADAKTALNAGFPGIYDLETVADWFGGISIPSGTFVATADELAAAIEEGGSVVLGADVTLADDAGGLTIPAGKEVVLDLNGKTLSYTSTIQNESLITNKGTLTINDSAESGVINYNYTGDADPNFGKGNYTISNAGTLTVNGGKITIADLRAHAKYPINNNSTSGDAKLTINGGHLYNYNTSAIRQFCNSTTYKNDVIINGGLIEGYCAIWMQNPGKNTVNGSLTITGGEIRTTAKAYVEGTSELKDVSSRLYCTIDGEGGAWSADSFVNITGGVFNENVVLAEEAPFVTILNGTFNGKIEAQNP